MVNWEDKAIFIILKYWLKIVNTEENKYIKYIYKTMLSDIDSNDRKKELSAFVKETVGKFRLLWSLVAAKCRRCGYIFVNC